VFVAPLSGDNDVTPTLYRAFGMSIAGGLPTKIAIVEKLPLY
jgi:hypothetical protein